MALVITSHDILPIHTEISMVMMLVLKLWPSTIIAQWKHASFYNMSVLHCGLQQ